MSNYKALGIEKDMNVEFDNYNKSALQILLDSCYFDHPSITNKVKNGEYCTIEVIECENNFWYKDLIGFQFFCRISFRDYGHGRFISEFTGVKLSGNREIKFRGFDPKDVIII